MAPRSTLSEEQADLLEVAEGQKRAAEAELEELRQLFVGIQYEQLDQLLGWINDPARRADEISRVLPRAVRLRPPQDEQLGEALAPALEAALADLARRDPKAMARVLSPLIGPAIRDALKESLATPWRSLRMAFSTHGIRWWLEARRRGESFAEIVDQHTLVYRIEHLCLFHRTSQMLLLQVSHRDRNTAPLEDATDALANVHQILSPPEAPTKPKPLVSTSRKVAIEQGTQLTLAAVVRGDAPEALRSRLQYALDTIQLERRSSLKKFVGDPTPFELCRPQLEKYLEAEYNEPRSSLALPAALLAVCLCAMAIWWAVS